MNNRPLPEPPRPAPSEGGGSSRSGTPKSVFDTIQRPPSVQLEKIKTKANATLDRMAQLQQRYRQQKASQLDLNTSGSEQVSSRVGAHPISDLFLVPLINVYRLVSSFPFCPCFPFSLSLALSFCTFAAQQHLANGANFEHWSNISPSPSHFRSGSMSSGLNSSHFDLSDDSHNFPNSLLFQQQQLQRQRQAAGAQRRQMSTSVFNLNTLPRRPLAETQQGGAWLANQRMQQVSFPM